MKSPAHHITRLIDFFYAGPVKKILPHQTFRYAAAAGLNMVFTAILYYLIYHYVFGERLIDLGFVAVSSPIATLCVVFPITFFNGFWLNRYIAFRQSPLRGRVQFMRYALSVAGALLANYGLMKLFIEGFRIYPTPSKLLTDIIVVGYSYLMQKYFTFRGCPED